MRALLLLVVALFWLSPTHAGGGGKEDPDPEGIKYFELFPRLITNYQRSDGKIGFLQIGVQVKVKGAAHVELLKTHLPLLQDTMVWLVRAQNEESVKSMEKREALRQDAMKQLAEKLETETKKKEVILDVLFTQFMFQ